MYRLYHEISHSSYTLSFFNKPGMWWLKVNLTFLTDEYMITVCLTVVDQTVPWMTKRINNVCAFFTLFSLPILPPQSIFPMVQGNHFVPIWVSDGHQMSSHPKNNTFATDSSIITSSYSLKMMIQKGYKCIFVTKRVGKWYSGQSPPIGVSIGWRVFLSLFEVKPLISAGLQVSLYGYYTTFKTYRHF